MTILRKITVTKFPSKRFNFYLIHQKEKLCLSATIFNSRCKSCDQQCDVFSISFMSSCARMADFFMIMIIIHQYKDPICYLPMKEIYSPLDWYQFWNSMKNMEAHNWEWPGTNIMLLSIFFFFGIIWDWCSNYNSYLMRLIYWYL